MLAEDAQIELQLFKLIQVLYVNLKVVQMLLLQN